ncbi:hypothetical protein [Methylobacterium flocculans]|uniref:hypothetical protein n=1 Tax=Methylobacterium flocculans TaxID=2984843 RepID=UPI0021F28A0C|nr:hypothetical protein [Methylobacterium sp. FF17]
MNITVSHHVLHAFWGAYEQPHPGPARPEVAVITARIVASGWAGLMDIENLLVATDPRLWRLKVRDLVEAFGVTLQPVFERPARGAKDAEGIERVSAVDLARLLILLESAGLAVDPMPLCGALAPAVSAKRLLTAAELMIHWRVRGQPTESLTFLTKLVNIGCEGSSYRTPAGYRVRVFFEEEGDPGDFGDEVPGTVSMLVIDPPQSHRLPKAIHLAATA